MSNPEKGIVDPVAERAAREAVAATEPVQRHPWVGRFLTLIVVLVVVIGTAGLILGIINTFHSNHQDDLQRQQQDCIVKLVRNFTEEQKVRSHIADDDRKALDDLVFSVARAKTSQEVERALNKFKKEAHTNDVRRAKYPVPTFNSNVCVTTSNSSPTPVGPLPSTSPQSSAKSSATPKSAGTSRNPVHSVGASQSPHASRTARGTVSGTHVAQQPPVTSAKRSASSSHSSSSTNNKPQPSPSPSPSKSSQQPIVRVPILGPIVSPACTALPALNGVVC